MVYMDNAATSWPKPSRVTEEMARCIREYCANPGRSGHWMSIACSKEVFAARQAVSRFFNISNPLRVCFTKNTTEALNIGIKGFIKDNFHVITTSMEHNSVMRPLHELQCRGVSLTIVHGDKNGKIDASKIEESITAGTRMVVCTLSSNVNGIILPIKEIGEICRSKNIVFLVDAAQGAGSVMIDVEDMKIDILAFPGHKGLLGPQGTGGLYIREGIDIDPLYTGGTGSYSLSTEQPEMLPDRMESGTLNTPGIVGLRHGIEFIENMGIKYLAAYKRTLFERLYRGLECINGVRLFSPFEGNSGIIALEMEGMDSTVMCRVLSDSYGIAARGGLHCSPFAHRTLGTLPTGLLRLSPGCFTTHYEVDYVIEAVKQITAGYSNI